MAPREIATAGRRPAAREDASDLSETGLIDREFAKLCREQSRTFEGEHTNTWAKDRFKIVLTGSYSAELTRERLAGADSFRQDLGRELPTPGSVPSKSGQAGPR
jgi:hypothetical protein